MPRSRPLTALFNLVAIALLFPLPTRAQPSFRVLALAEPGGIHKPFVDAAKRWLAQEAQAEHFTVDYIENTDPIDDAYLSQYRLFLQLNFPPYGWTPTASAAFRRYIEEGRGGWIGFHHATLLGEFDGYPMDPWFSNFMGGIRYQNYIATFVSGTVHVEAPEHPVMRNVPASFEIRDEEWYTYNHSPRPNVHVLASVDENSYTPSTRLKMGDHPVVWTNEHFAARNLYIFMGHRPEHFQNASYTTLFHNAISWAASADTPPQKTSAFRVLAFHSTQVESDHVEFARDAIRFFTALAHDRGFTFDTTTNWDDLNAPHLAPYNAILWLDDFPHTPAQRTAFETYMEHGGGWLGFHIAAYNDRDTHWPWFVRFLGGAVFYSNNWPPLPARLTVDNPQHPIAQHLPAAFESPANEWYIWKPDPRDNPDIQVLLTLDPANYPLGWKDTLTAGDLPVVWTNTRYRMLYLNMGHGDKVLTSPIQNHLFEDSLLWITNQPVVTNRASEPLSH